MANPNPSPATRWKPGQSGNPAGYSNKRRVSHALEKLLDAFDGADDDLARTWYAMATGRKDLLRDKKTGEQRKPDYQWFAMLLERLEGKVTQPITAGIEGLSLKWTDDRDDAGPDDADAPSGAEDGPTGSGPVQGPGLRPEVGQDPAGGGTLPGDGA